MFIVEGNIGAGKSTLLNLIKESLVDVNVVQEPVQRWGEGENGKSLLAKFYHDPKYWAFALETYTLSCRVLDQLNMQLSKTKKNIVERSVYSGYYCFAKNDYISGFLTKMEWEIYTQFFNFLISKKLKAPQGFIYLQTTPEVVFERVKKRARSSESEISLDYLKNIHERHVEFLIDKDVDIRLKHVPVLVLDGNLDFENNSKVQQDFIQKIKEFIFV